MATNERFVPVPRAAVWNTLADPASHGLRVVGSKTIRDAEAGCSRLHHTIGVGPFTVKDHKVSLDAERPLLLRLRAKARPLGAARVTMEITPSDGGTLVGMTERPDGPTAILALNPLARLFTEARNAESLMRPEALALGRAR